MEMEPAGTVLALSNQGLAPAEIDNALGLDAGQARRTMVRIWQRDKDDASRADASRRAERRQSKRAPEA